MTDGLIVLAYEAQVTLEHPSPPTSTPNPPSALALSLSPKAGMVSLPTSTAELPTVTAIPPTPPTIRGRPRSSSISNGSAPPPQPQFSPAAAPFGSGWANKGIIAPQPMLAAPTGGRINRHRRTQSVSPPGFPVISETSQDGFKSPGHASSALFGGASMDPPLSPSTPVHHVKPSPINIPGPSSQLSHHPQPHHHQHHHHSKRHSISSPVSATSPSGSPSSRSPSHAHHSQNHAHHSAFPSSHAALLQGVRSHALPSSPTLDASDPHYSSGHARSRSASHDLSALMSTSPQSPPFGPTPARAPSPLSLELNRRDSSSNSAVVMKKGGEGEPETEEEGMDLGTSGEGAFALYGMGDDNLPGSFDRPSSPHVPQPSTSSPQPSEHVPVPGGGSNSPPLLPLPNLPPTSSPLASPSLAGSRCRSSSFGSEHVSPVSLFMEQSSPPVNSFSQFDLGAPSEDNIRRSPPLEALPAATPSALFPTLVPPQRPVSPPLSPIPFATSSPDLRESPILASSTSGLANDDILPPPSPHARVISLPPPVVAPAPLPPHLDPNHHPLHRSKKAAVAAAREGLSTSGPEGAFVPKRHSPLASASSSEDEASDDEMDPPLAEEIKEDGSPREGGERVGMDGRDVEEVRRQLGEAERTEMDFASASSALTAILLQREKEASSTSSPPSTAFAPATEEDKDTEEEEREDDEEHGLQGSGGGLERMGRRNAFGALGFMDVDDLLTLPSSPSEATLDESASRQAEETNADAEEEMVVAIDEDSLSALEKIFVCAKSENHEERARVAHHLAIWLQAVEIGEAVEYVLPLLAGLATDSEELVKEVFAPQLDAIMWHFFSQCPLLEIEVPAADATSETAASPVGSPVPSRYTALSSTSQSQPSPTSTLFPSDLDSTASAPTTSKTSPSNTEISDAPRISVTTFTSLLGALLTDQSAQVANSTQATLVRFLCRLKGKPLPAYTPSPSASPMVRDVMLAPPEVPSSEIDQASQRASLYHLTDEAKRILEDEFINGIVLGLARLDDDERDDEDGESDLGGQMDGVEAQPSSAAGAPTTPDGGLEGAHDDSHSLSSSLVLSPEEDLIEDSWMNSSSETGTAPGPTAESWGEPLVSYFNDANDRPQNEYSRLVLDSSSPAGQVYSSFSPDGHGDEEAAIGKLVSMSLIGAIAATDCFEPEVLATQLLPEVERMKSEATFYVRKEAVQALASLARTLPIEVFEMTVLPLHAVFAQDPLWHVRRAACLALPTLCKRLPPALLRSQAVANVKVFSDDSSRNVRSGALEVCGELVHLFYGDPEGVPSELVAFFLGQPLDPPVGGAPVVDEDVFTPLQTALDSPPSRFFDQSPWSIRSPNTNSATRDPDRPVMCAFNLPAVALTLGRERWHLLREYYLSLCADKTDKVRQSLASSMHEIAKIIGPDQADADLVEPFSLFVRDFDFIQGALLENLASLLGSFGVETGRKVLAILNEAWGAVKLWRRREALTRDLATLAHFVDGPAIEEMLALFMKAFKDPVAAVRDQAVYAIPAALASTAPGSLARSKLVSFLAVFSEDSSYRNRVTYVSCALATVRSGVDRECFEDVFLDSLDRLARDKVVNVRIGVARVIAETCRAPALYIEPEARSPIAEVLQLLAQSTDRDIANAVAKFAKPKSSASSSPPPAAGEVLDRSGARSRMDMYGESGSDDEDEDGEAKPPLPVARRSHLDLHGIDDDTMDEIPLDGAPALHLLPPLPESHPSSPTDNCDIEMDEGGSDEDDGDEGVLLEASEMAGRSPQLVVTQELEGEEFLEVSRR